MKKLQLIIFTLILNIIGYAQLRPEDRVSNRILDSLENLMKSFVDKPFNQFNATSLDEIQYSEADFKGKITLVNFWFEGCHPCIAEFDALNKIYDKYKENKNFQFLSFTFDNPIVANGVAKKYQMKYPILIISQQECYRLHCASGFPNTVLVSETGTICFIKSGGPIDPEEATKAVNKEVVPKLEELLNTIKK